MCCGRHAARRPGLRRALRNASQGSDVSPLHAAAAADAVDALATLVRAWRRECATDPGRDNAGAFARDGGKRTPLHVACALGAYDAAATLVALHAGDEAARKAFLAAEDARGQRPLHRAARANDGAVASLLLGAGADSEATDDAGRTARDACAIGAASAARRLDAMRARCATGTSTRRCGWWLAGAFPSLPPREGDTVLTRAAAAGRGDVVDAAIALGAGQIAESTTTIPENAAAPVVSTGALVSPARPDRVGPRGVAGFRSGRESKTTAGRGTVVSLRSQCEAARARRRASVEGGGREKKARPGGTTVGERRRAIRAVRAGGAREGRRRRFTKRRL